MYLFADFLFRFYKSYPLREAYILLEHYTSEAVNSTSTVSHTLWNDYISAVSPHHLCMTNKAATNLLSFWLHYYCIICVSKKKLNYSERIWHMIMALVLQHSEIDVLTIRRAEINRKAQTSKQYAEHMHKTQPHSILSVTHNMASRVLIAIARTSFISSESS